jgi:hypothetical protein
VAEIGCGLFLSLQQSQDVEGVDMGHILIGLDARMSWSSRVPNIPAHGATGVEITTWVGDLGGATARLALDRTKNPSSSADKYFRGTDYGAPSNLEGDIGAYLVADAGSDSVSEPLIPSDSIAAAIVYYFASHNYPTHYRRFLELQGGIFSGTSLTNRATVQQSIANRLAAFGKRYLQQHLFNRGDQYSPAQQRMAEEGLGPASQVIAAKFVDWLLVRSTASAHPHRRHRDSHPKGSHGLTVPANQVKVQHG